MTTKAATPSGAPSTRGITTFDTAAYYGRGPFGTDSWGRLWRPCGRDVVLATKVFPSDLARNKVMAACERSLRNLKDRRDRPLPDPLAGGKLQDAQGADRGKPWGALCGPSWTREKIRAIGVLQLLPVLRSPRRRSTVPIESLQPPYSLFLASTRKRMPCPGARNVACRSWPYSPHGAGTSDREVRFRIILSRKETHRRGQQALSAGKTTPVCRPPWIACAPLPDATVSPWGNWPLAWGSVEADHLRHCRGPQGRTDRRERTGRRRGAVTRRPGRNRGHRPYRHGSPRRQPRAVGVQGVVAQGACGSLLLTAPNASFVQRRPSTGVTRLPR